MGFKVLETKRLYLRWMNQADLPFLKRILQDEQVMYAYEHAFSDEEAEEWLERQMKRYQEDGIGLWIAVLKETEEPIGQCGITMQDFYGKMVPEIGYLFCKEYWNHGYATEAADGCKNYAFQELGLKEVYSIIRDNNLPSQKVARNNGMEIRGKIIKHYYHRDMPHFVFSARNTKV